MILFSIISIIITALVVSYVVPLIAYKMAQDKFNNLKEPNVMDIINLTPPEDDFYKAQDYLKSAEKYPFFSTKAQRMGSGKILVYDAAFMLLCQEIRNQSRDSSEAEMDRQMAVVSSKIDSLKNIPGTDDEQDKLMREYKRLSTSGDNLLEQSVNARISKMNLCEKWKRFFDFMREEGMRPSYETDPEFQAICR